MYIRIQNIFTTKIRMHWRTRTYENTWVLLARGQPTWTHICNTLADGLCHVCAQQQGAEKFEDPRQHDGLPEGRMAPKTYYVHSSSTNSSRVWYALFAVDYCSCSWVWLGLRGTREYVTWMPEKMQPWLPLPNWICGEKREFSYRPCHSQQ